jgi:hypothetical protein
MIKAVCFSEALVRVYLTTQRCNLKHQTRFPLKERKTEHVIKMGKGKGKAIPLQVWTGPEGSRRLRLPDFMTIDT